MVIMNLMEQLAEAERALQANSPLEAQIKFGQMIEQLQQSGIASGLAVGEKAKDFQLTNGVRSAIYN